MMGYTDGQVAPSAERYLQLIAQRRGAAPLDVGQPYPFFLAHPLDAPLDEFATSSGRAERLASSNGSTTASARRW